MVLKSVLTSIFLLASAVVAVPAPEHSEPQLVRDLSDLSTTVVDNPYVAGAVLPSFPKGTFQHINATITAPTFHGPPGSFGYIFVGIDGITCRNVLLRAGLQLTQNGHTYTAWAQWYPENSQSNIDLGIAAGDRIHINIATLGDNVSFVTFRNNRNGQKKTLLVTSNTPLCMSDAGWYIQRPQYQPFPGFSEIVFDNAKASGHGKEYLPQGARLYDIEEGNKVLTQVSVSGATVKIKHK